MATDPTPWISALRDSHQRLRSVSSDLSSGGPRSTSYATEWSIADVLSHLGSQAEIFQLFLKAGLSDEAAPGREQFQPIWDSWNARTPEAQARDAIRGDAEILMRLEQTGAEDQRRFHLSLFGRDLDWAGLARMRLSEHAIHTWDIAVALDSKALVGSSAVNLLIDTLPELAARTGKAGTTVLRLGISTSDPERHFHLEVSDTVLLRGSESGSEAVALTLPAEALVRLVYGRLDSGHTPPAKAGGVDLDELRSLFPGF
ncbi:MAG: maleylpyruvate isomerase family mycothiol-dependent enzyme [Candidatus Dormibacteria bacterium]